ncbi:MAG: hypothetical protein EXQ85_08795 [Alphaproteobacteria bacterium]|nr:hypothetical protein [Alphaproteobacteria bacterium]
MWATPYIALDPTCRSLTAAVNERFLAGYTRVRPFTADERRLYPLFIAGKEMNFLCAKMSGVNVLGPGTFLYAGWDWFAESVRRHIAEAGLP